MPPVFTNHKGESTVVNNLRHNHEIPKSRPLRRCGGNIIAVAPHTVAENGSRFDSQQWAATGSGNHW
jgi:hypothetical protein